MKINKIQIQNILGIDRLEFEPGKITTISGQNASGKTSVLEAIKGALGGGHDGTLLKNGKDEGQVVLIFDNGETLTKKMNRDKSTLVMEGSDGKKMKLGPSYLKEIIDSVGINPIQILTADPKTRIKLLLDSVPMELPVDEIKLITGLDRSGDTGHPLRVIEDIKKDIFEERAYINAEVKKGKARAEEMNKTIPWQKDKKDWAVEGSVLRTELEKKNGGKQSRIADLATKYDTAIIEVKEKAQKDIDVIQKDLADFLEKLRVQDREIIDRINTETNPEIDELKGKITEADINSKNQAKISTAIEYVEKHKQEIELQKKAALSQTGMLESLDTLKAELMENLPIENLEVRNGDIYISGVPFDTLNEAAKITFCLFVAGLRKSKLPLVCVDGLESLDESTFQKFVELAEKTDMQFFVTRVSEDKNLTLK